ncbi:DNA-binding protein HU-beta [compost metagenome]
MIDALQEVITDELKAKGNVVLVGFGTFQVKEKPARMGRNPSTGAPISIEAKTEPMFKAGTVLRRAVN